MLDPVEPRTYLGSLYMGSIRTPTMMGANQVNSQSHGKVGMASSENFSLTAKQGFVF